MSGMPAPAVAPHPPVIRPEAVEPRPKKPNYRGLWIFLILTFAALVAGAYVWQRARTAGPSPAQGTAASSAIRTAKVSSGPIERTLRLTGVTAGANYTSLSPPRFRERAL